MATARRPSQPPPYSELDDNESNPFLTSPPPPTAPGAAPPLPARNDGVGSSSSLQTRSQRGPEWNGGREMGPRSASAGHAGGTGGSGGSSRGGAAGCDPFAPTSMVDAARVGGGLRGRGGQQSPPHKGPEKQSSTDLTPDEQEALDIAAAIAASHAVSQPAVVSAEMAAAIAASRQSFTQGTSINSARQASGSRRGSGSAASGATQQDASSSRGPSPPGRAAAGASSASGGSSGNVSGGFNSQSSRTPPRSRSGTGGSASAAGGGPTFSGGGVGGLPAANMFSPSETVVATTNGTAVVEASASPANADSKSNGGGQEDRGHAESNSWNWQGLGRSFFGAMMKAAAGEGSPAADGETARKVTGKGGATHARELTPYTMQQTAGGKYGVVVMRKNKQDTKPVQVSVGVYDTAYEALRAAEAFSPPVWQEPNRNSTCAVCSSTFGFLLKRRHHCRNCGRLVCSSCAETFWPRSMLPPTYNVDITEKKVRVCSTCYGAGERFRKALLSGCEEEAMSAYSTGCVNLRVPYTIYHNELPVHCAAAGGNLNILAWLIEDRCCPIFLDREKKVALGDSRRLSVMGAAAASGHITVMRYLAFTQGCKVTEIRDMHTLWRALEKCLHEGSNVVSEEDDPHRTRRRIGDPPAFSKGGGGSGGGGSAAGGAYAVGGHNGSGSGGAEVAAAVNDDDTGCIVCFERPVDCTLVPCGHHCCCLQCAAQFELCPVCRAPVAQKIRAITV